MTVSPTLPGFLQIKLTLNRLLAALFLLFALPLGLFLVYVVPLGQVADEQGHIIRAEGLLHGGLIGVRQAVVLPDGRRVMRGGTMADQSMLWVVTSRIYPGDRTPLTLPSAGVHAERARPWDGHTSFVPNGTIASYMPVFYVPAAVAIGVTKLLGHGPFSAFLAARLANLACFLVAGTAALLLARRAQALLFATLAVPSTLDLAASANQDGLLIVASVLAVALLTHAADRPVPISRTWSYWLAAVLIACVATVKPPYLPLAAMLLLPLPVPLSQVTGTPGQGWQSQWPETWRRLGAVLFVLLATFAWLWVHIHFSAAPVPRDPYQAGPLYHGPRPALFNGTDMGAQLRVLLADPRLFFTLPIDAIGQRIGMMGHQLVAVLGWLNLVLPDSLFVLWLVALAAALVADGFAPARATLAWRGVEVLLLLLAVALTIQGIYLSQYLSWTSVGENGIRGEQGRYFLPLLPVLGLAVSRFAFPGGVVPRLVFLAVPAAAAFAGLVVVPRVVVAFYYMG